MAAVSSGVNAFSPALPPSVHYQSARSAASNKLATLHVGNSASYGDGAAANTGASPDSSGDSGGAANDTDDGGEQLKANRFSKFAPDLSTDDLSQEDFRAQLKENMKADLERRRRENPNRGSQPTKNYLENL